MTCLTLPPTLLKNPGLFGPIAVLVALCLRAFNSSSDNFANSSSVFNESFPKLVNEAKPFFKVSSLATSFNALINSGFILANDPGEVVLDVKLALSNEVLPDVGELLILEEPSDSSSISSVEYFLPSTLPSILLKNPGFFI